MSRPDLPLAVARQRLRGKPGRPRKAESGYTTGTLPPQGRMNGYSDVGTQASPAVAPRLLDLQGTAAYLGVSPWTVRDLEAGGILRRVRVPLPGNGELRKLLFDRADLDRLVETWKEAR